MVGLAGCERVDSLVVLILCGLAGTGDDRSTWFLLCGGRLSLTAACGLSEYNE